MGLLWRIVSNLFHCNDEEQGKHFGWTNIKPQNQQKTHAVPLRKYNHVPGRHLGFSFQYNQANTSLLQEN